MQRSVSATLPTHSMSHHPPAAARRERRRRRLVAIAVAAWCAAVGWGWCAMTAYSLKTDDDPAAMSADWPSGSQLPRAAGRPTLLVFLHPKCPCSRATATELERLLDGPVGAADPACQVIVVAVTPVSPDESWTATPLLDRCGRLPGAQVVVDRGGEEAALFGAATSGTVLWFDAAGRRQYGGGITIARGHEGASVGGAALACLLNGEEAAVDCRPAFGCRLPSPASQAAPRPGSPATPVVE